jgi:hypothetical protein
MRTVLFLLLVAALPQRPLAQINGTWKYRALTVVRQTDTVPLFHADSSRNLYGLERIRISFKDSGRYEALRFNGSKKTGSWKMEGGHIIVDTDTNTVAQQSDTLLRTHADVRLVDLGYDFSGVLVTELVKLPGCATLFSLRSGDWYDPAVWSCNRVPDREDDVTIKAGHTITLSKPMGDHNCKKLTLETGSQFVAGGKLEVLK